MPDVVVTVPQNFRWDGSPHKGLLAWADEGALPGEPDEFRGEFDFTTGGMRPDIKPGERVYIVCEGRLRGYAPLVRMEFTSVWGGNGRVYLWRAGGAVAVTIDTPIKGFRGWRYRWWPREQERPFPEWLDDAKCKCAECKAAREPMPLFEEQGQ